MNETQLIENYLLKTSAPEDQVLMEAKLLLDNELREKAKWQQQTYLLVNMHGRQCLKKELEIIHTKLFSEKRFENFRRKIQNIFKP